MTETQGDNINFDGQQAYDVADLVKQYFRELPEALLTNKLSETFIAIYQRKFDSSVVLVPGHQESRTDLATNSIPLADVPVDLRPDAVQCVLLLLPDEHREALETLLDFLNHVANNSPYNQMTASNLAVCLAPSLFHFNHSNASVTNRSSSVSPRRRKTVGIPDQRELSENKAAHDCLLYLLKMHRELFMVGAEASSIHRSRAIMITRKENYAYLGLLLLAGLFGHVDAVSLQLHGGEHSGRVGGTRLGAEAGLEGISVRLHHGVAEGSAREVSTSGVIRHRSVCTSIK